MRKPLAALLLCWTPLLVAAELQPAMELLELRLAGHQLQAEYAATAEQRRLGLMGRTALAGDRGMLFRFDEVRPHCLWMKDTPLPLSAAFFDEGGVLVDVIDLEPFKTDIRCSNGPARYALEVNQGWFAEHGIGPGTRVEGLPGD
jgi:hypothetical protein